jgi:hypothetical protein
LAKISLFPSGETRGSYVNAATNSRSNCLPVASAELEKRGYPKHWLALGVSAETPEALMFLCA